MSATSETAQRTDLLRLVTCGSVDDGKSTLIGRLLFDTKQILADQLEREFEDLGRDADHVLAAVFRALGDFRPRANFQIQVLSSLFYRNKGAYAVGKIVNGFSELPFALPILHTERGQLIVEDLLRFVEQPADQGRLAVIDAAAGDEAQEFLRFLLGKPGANVGTNEVSIGFEWPGHQKYPSCFFFSIEALPASRSIARPWRSDVVVSSISATISSTVAASLSTAPDSG